LPATQPPSNQELLQSGYTWPPGGGSQPVASSPLAGAASPAAAQVGGNALGQTQQPTLARSLPANTAGGSGCLDELSARSVAFRPLDEKRGIETPVSILGPIGDIRYYAQGNTPFVSDCRLALALHEVSDELRAVGVTRARFSGVYVYRTSRVGRLSYHAYGLAIDLHSFHINGREYSVKRDFARGIGDGCSHNAPPLNRVSCVLRRAGLFKEMLTPDYNADHHDHFHLGLVPRLL
jgi:hypothetical protein